MLHSVVRIGALASSIIVLAGCGLDEQGLVVSVDGSSAEDVVVADAASDAAAEGSAACPDAAPASCADAAPSWSPALYSPTGAAPCPAGYDAHDLAYAVPAAPTCECQCTSGPTPACDTSKITYNYGVAVNVCLVGSGTIALSGTCTATNQSTFGGEVLEVDPPAVVGGCGGGTSIPPNATQTNVRLCTPQCASDESACAAQGTLEACVYAPGNVATCPSSYPAGPFYVGASPQVTCDTCSCVETGDCTASTAHLYGNAQCGGGDQSYPMDGQCHTLAGGQIGTFQSAAVKPTLKSASCKISPGASSIAYGGDSFTVCCE